MCHPDVIWDCPDFDSCFMSHPMAEFWNSELNEKTPLEIKLTDNRSTVYLDCPHCFHTYGTQPWSVSKGGGCSFCSNKQRCSKDIIKDCRFCFPKCFASVDKSAFWDYTKNDASPYEIAKVGSGQYYFTCGDCKHSIRLRLSNIAQGRWCAFCANQLRCNEDDILDCSFCFDHSFLSHPKSEFWDLAKNDLTPLQIALNDIRRFWFKCDTCNHSFAASPSQVMWDHWCPFCCNRQRCPVDKILDCDMCFSKCFMSHPKAEFWDVDKNTLTPLEVSQSQCKKYFFVCDQCDEPFAISLYNVQLGHWCQKCTLKTQNMVYQWCKEMFYDEKVEWEQTFSWCPSDMSARHYSFDIVMLKSRVIVEVDGSQHFMVIKKWQNDPEEYRRKDVYKMKKAIENGYRIIRIHQESAWKHPDLFKSKLEMSLKETSDVVYLTLEGDTVYDLHQNDMLVEMLDDAIV